MNTKFINKAKLNFLDSNPTNSFLEVPRIIRVLLIAYYIVYLVFQPAVLTFYAEKASWSVYMITVIYDTLLFLPILFYRTNYGLLHPLIFPLLFSLARKITSYPELLLGIFYPRQLSSNLEISHILMTNWHQSEINFVYIQAQLLNILAIVSYYLAFFYSNPKKLKVKFLEPVNMKYKLIIFMIIGLAIISYYLQTKGGIQSHLLSWSIGRFNALAGDGPIFVLAKAVQYCVLIWYVTDKKADKSLLFWVLLVSVAPLQFILTGSRSSVVYFGALFIMLNMWKKQSVPKSRIVIFTSIVLIIIGFLGKIRSSTYSGVVDLDEIFNRNPIELVQDTREEIKRRNDSNGYLAVVSKVPKEVNYLYGESYVGAFLFFIPRFIWESKPRGAGAISGERIFMKQSGAGVPPGPIGEAYWNFSFFGVIIIFVLYGYFHKWLAVNIKSHGRSAAYIIFYIISLAIFSPTGIAIVSYFHAIIPVLLILAWMKAFKLDRNEN